MSFERLPEGEWHRVAEMMGVRLKLEGSGYEASKRMMTKTIQAAESSGDPFSDTEVDFLSAHILSVKASPGFASQLNSKVVRHAREALRRDLNSGPRSKVGLFASWPSSWLTDYRAAIEGNCPVAFAGVVQNALAPNGRLWKP